MIKTIILSTLLFGTIKLLGQDSLRGEWTLQTYNIGESGETKIKGKIERDKIAFDGHGSYTRSYYARELTADACLHLTYDFVDEKTSEKYIDKDGHEIKAGRIRKRIEKGKYERIGLSKVRFRTDKGTYIKTIKLYGLNLIVSDTIFKKMLYLRYRKK